MCPTWLGKAHERNGIFGEFGIEFDKKFDNGFDKPYWEKMPACGYSRPQEVFMRQFYLGKTSSGYYKAYFIDPVTGIRDYGKSQGLRIIYFYRLFQGILRVYHKAFVFLKLTDTLPL